MAAVSPVGWLPSSRQDPASTEIGSISPSGGLDAQTRHPSQGKKVAVVPKTPQEETRSDVKDIALEDVVDSDPLFLKRVDITDLPRPVRNWSRE